MRLRLKFEKFIYFYNVTFEDDVKFYYCQAVKLDRITFY